MKELMVRFLTGVKKNQNWLIFGLTRLSHCKEKVVKTRLDIKPVLGILVRKSCLIILMAVLLRFVNLGAKPFHHDESILGYFSWILFKHGAYQYHPLSHGPLLYYLTALSYKLFSVFDASARVMPALFGGGLVGLLYLLRPYLRLKTVYLLMVLAATSPLLVYVSRFARPDMINLFFTLLLIVSTLNYVTWQRPAWIYGVLISLAFSYTNHELTYITTGIWLLSLVGLLLSLDRQKRRALLLALHRDRWHLGLALTISLLVMSLLFSSFGRFPEGLSRALPNPNDQNSALGYWITQHGVQRGSQPIYYYLLLLPLYEIIIFILGTIGMIRGIFSRSALWRFISIWALLSLTIYSIAGERMPWLTVHTLLPLLLTTGFLIDHYWPKVREKPRIVAVGVFALTLMMTTYNMYRLSFINPSNPIELAVYVQTQPIVKETAEKLTSANPRPTITLGPDLSWPLTWYLRDAPQNYTAHLSTPPTDWAIYSTNEAEANQAAKYYQTARRLPFRSWWIPKESWPGITPLLRYYFFRQTWSELGSYDLLLFSQPLTGNRP